jgi:predicted Mrr-cat superfamily restriction endonuclease
MAARPLDADSAVRTWGIHRNGPDLDFIAVGVIALDRPWVGDLVQIGPSRDRIKARLAREYPRESANTVAAWTGVLLRFAFEAEHGDLVVHPDRREKTLALGRIVSDYYWDHSSDLHCRRVRWTHLGLARGEFSEAAKKAVSARTAFFEIREAGAAEFRSVGVAQPR